MKPKKILIVDYDTKSLDAMTNLFLSYEVEILKATDGQMAYKKYKTEHPDLILLEAMLPKLHGFDLAKKIYEETKGTVPIVIVTGLYKEPKYKSEALRSFGVAQYFEKPYDSEKLVGAVMNLLHEEIDVDVELPEPDSVIALVSEMIETPSPAEEKDSR